MKAAIFRLGCINIVLDGSFAAGRPLLSHFGQITPLVSLALQDVRMFSLECGQLEGFLVGIMHCAGIKWLSCVGLIVGLSSVAAVAQDSTGKKADDDTNKKANSVPGAEVVDELITNNNLRAYSGSLSRWSIASQFNYNGGTIQSPFSQDRPDISDQSGTTIKSDLDGAISVKYNLSAIHSLMFGIGIRWIAPLTPGGPSNYDGTIFDVMNPYLQYQYIYKFWGIQAVLQVQDMQWTQADFTAVGYLNQLSFDQELMYEFKDTKLSIGCSFNGQYVWFNKSGSYGSPTDPDYIADVATVQGDYQLDLQPIVEYELSDRINLRTLIDVWDFEHYASQSNKLTFVHDKVYQEIGVGIKITRDIFIYPNVQFIPDELRPSQTNVGVTATINVF